MAKNASTLNYVFKAAELKKLIDQNPKVKEIAVTLELGVQSAKGKKGMEAPVLTAKIYAWANVSSKAKGKMLLGDGDGSVDGFPIPPGVPTEG